MKCNNCGSKYIDSTGYGLDKTFECSDCGNTWEYPLRMCDRCALHDNVFGCSLDFSLFPDYKKGRRCPEFRSQSG